MSTEFTQETKKSVLKMSVNRDHSFNEGNLNGTSVDQAMYMNQVSQYSPSCQCRLSSRLLEGD